METSDLAQMQLTALDEAEVSEISGGNRIGRKLFTLALFAACPALGVFHLGLREGYRNEAEQYQ